MPSENTPTQKQTAKNVHTNLHKLVIIHMLHTLHKTYRIHKHLLLHQLPDLHNCREKLVITHCSITQTLRIIV